MLQQSDYFIIRIGVPSTHADTIRTVLGDAGAGKQGPYSHCSGSFGVTGRYIPLEGANPAIGVVGEPQEVVEEVIQTICHKDIIEEVVKVVRSAHPYEEPPIDIIPRYEVV